MKLYLGHDYFNDPVINQALRVHSRFVLLMRWGFVVVITLLVGLSTLPFYGVFAVLPSVLSAFGYSLAVIAAIGSGWVMCIFALYDDRRAIETMANFLREKQP